MENNEEKEGDETKTSQQTNEPTRTKLTIHNVSAQVNVGLGLVQSLSYSLLKIRS